ncbi:MAG: hypothetical protein MJ051_04350 [Akkermansia sp.]|nr:hypothetical protein [Akkermansia sp.]
MKSFRRTALALILGLAAASHAETYSPEVEAMLRPLPEKAVLMGNLVLTVDEAAQNATQDIMAELMRGDENIAWGCGMVMNAATGQLLALVKESREEADYDLALAPVIVPGATFRVLGTAAALDKGLLTLDSSVEATPFILKDEEDLCEFTAPAGAPAALSVREALLSDNAPAAARIALTCGPALYQQTLDSFGLTKATGIGIQGDSACDLEDLTDAAENGSPVLAAMGAGQEYVRASLLQLASVYATLANGGERITPRIIKGLRLNDGVRMLPTLPAEHRRVVSEETASALCGVLAGQTLTACSLDTEDEAEETRPVRVAVRMELAGDTPLIIAVALCGETDDNQATAAAESLLNNNTPNKNL